MVVRSRAATFDTAVTDPDSVASYRIVLGVSLPAHNVEQAIEQASLNHLEPRVAANGMHTSVTITTSGRSQAEAEQYARQTLEQAVGMPVRVILTVSL